MTTCGLPEALSVKVTVPVLVPLAIGLKVTLTVQNAAELSVPGQLFACE